MVPHPKDDEYLNAAIPKRIKMFESIQAEQKTQRLSLSPDPIKVTLLDGTVKDAAKWQTAPFDVAKEISKNLANNALIARVNGVLWDMARPLEQDCELRIYKFEDDEGRDTFWHSSAHILSQSLEMEYGCKLRIGPCTTRGEGFYYDAFYGDLGLNDDHFKQIEAGVLKAAGQVVLNGISKLLALRIFVLYQSAYDITICCLCYVLAIVIRNSKILPASNPTNKKEYRLSITEMKITFKLCHKFFVKYTGRRLHSIDTDPTVSIGSPLHCADNHALIPLLELPLRMADFGVLHRNEASGALSGLTRVRRFQQDDAHIFCRESQIKDEVREALKFIDYVYEIFGFTYDLKLSTRPENSLGETATWEKAESALKEALDEFGKPWQLNEGDGALSRKFQCATLQLDFQLPNCFKLEYSAEDEAKIERPVMIHRAILGSVERMFAILRALQGQINVLIESYAKLQVREAQLAQYNYILVVGEQEAETGQVSVRVRDKADLITMSIEGLLERFSEDAKNFR
ncbi:Threonine--tRNA ligase [Arachis hypogaea]|nr:Threonine--tRNA ligase [Arachis hypogaea]